MSSEELTTFHNMIFELRNLSINIVNKTGDKTDDKTDNFYIMNAVKESLENQHIVKGIEILYFKKPMFKFFVNYMYSDLMSFYKKKV